MAALISACAFAVDRGVNLSAIRSAAGLNVNGVFHRGLLQTIADNKQLRDRNGDNQRVNVWVSNRANNRIINSITNRRANAAY